MIRLNNFKRSIIKYEFSTYRTIKTFKSTIYLFKCKKKNIYEKNVPEHQTMEHFHDKIPMRYSISNLMQVSNFFPHFKSPNKTSPNKIRISYPPGTFCHFMITANFEVLETIHSNEFVMSPLYRKGKEESYCSKVNNI